jgi:autotransporter-associated beta strand protein
MAIAALAPLCTVATAQTTITWANVGTVANTASNWVGTPTITNSVSTGNIWTFSNTAPGNNSVSFTSARSVVGIVFDANANVYSIGSGGFVLSIGGTGIANNSTTAQAITAAISVNNSQSWTTVAGGTLTTDTAVLTTTGSNRTLTIAGAGTTNVGALTFTAGQTGVGSLAVTSTGTTSLNGNNTYAGTTTMNAVGGTLALNGDNSVAAGAVTITAGTVKLGHNNALGSTALGTTVASGAVLDLNGRAVGAEALTLSGTGITSTGALVNTSATGASLGGTVTLNANTSIGAGNITLGNIGESGGARSLTKVGSGTLTLGGTSSYTGGTTISDGTVHITAGNSAGGQFTLSGANGPVLKLSNVDALATSATLLGSSSAANTGTVDLAVAGAYTLGSYTGQNMKFTASNGSPTSLTFTNNSTVTSGTAGGRTLTNTDANLSLVFGGTLDISSSTPAVGVIFAGAGNTTVNGAIFNGIGQTRTVTKNDAGILTLTAENTYGGDTTISGGKLSLSGAGSIANSPVITNNATFDVSAVTGGNYTLGSGQTYKGSGTTIGNLTINGAFTPGTSPGLAIFNNNLTLAGATTMEINGNTRDTLYDGVNTTGLLTYGGTLTMSFGAATTAGTTYDLFQIGGGGSTGSFSGVSIGGSYSLPALTNNSGIWTGNDVTNLLTFTFNQGTGDLVISAYSAIPEPSTFAALAGLGVLGLVATRRRRA